MKTSAPRPVPTRRKPLHIPLRNPSNPTTRPRQLSRQILLLSLVLVPCLILTGFEIAEAWRKTAQREATLPQLETMSQRSPHDGPLLALLGGRLAEAHLPTAADTLRHAIVAGEGTEVVWQTLAATTAATGDRPRALADLHLGRKALGTASSLDDALTRAEALGPTPDPAVLAQTIAPDGPTPLVDAHTRGSFLNGLAEWWGHRFPEKSGFTTRQRWVQQETENAQAERLWGLALRENQRLPEAAAALTRAVALAPRSPAAHLALADTLEQGGLREKAGLEYITCLKLRRDWLPALLGLGHNALEDHMGHAITAYRRATQVAPQSAEAWIGLGRSYFQDPSTYDKALAAFQTATRLAPERTDFFASYAELLRLKLRWSEAKALLRQRLHVVPDDAQCHYQLGTVLMDEASSPTKEAEAEAETREALRLFPHQPLAEVQLAQLLLRKGDARGAFPLIQEALAANPYNVNTLNLLTRVSRQVGDVKLAESLSVRSKSIFQDEQQLRVLEANEHKNLMDITVHQQLGQVYGRIGQPEKAQQEKELVHLLQTDPQKVKRDEQFLRASMQEILPDKTP